MRLLDHALLTRIAIMMPNPTAARPRRNYSWLLWLLAALVFTIDQLTKRLVDRQLALGQSWQPFGSFSLLRITHVSNTGAAFGILPDRGLFFVIVAIVVSAAIAFYYRRLPSHQWWLFLSLGLQLGGALGNLADRLRLGYVVDFVEVGIWPVFNVADSAIVTGVLILAWHFWREDRREQQATAVPSSPTANAPAAWPPGLSVPPAGDGHRHLEPEEAQRLIAGDGLSGGSGERVEPPHSQ